MKRMKPNDFPLLSSTILRSATNSLARSRLLFPSAPCAVRLHCASSSREHLLGQNSAKRSNIVVRENRLLLEMKPNNWIFAVCIFVTFLVIGNLCPPVIPSFSFYSKRIKPSNFFTGCTENAVFFELKSINKIQNRLPLIFLLLSIPERACISQVTISLTC